MYCRHCYQKIEDGSEICPLCKWPQGSLKITEEGVSRGAGESGSSYVEKENAQPVFLDPEPQEPEYMFCRKCGKRIPIDSAFCSKCGTSTNAPVSKTQPAPAAQQNAVQTPPKSKWVAFFLCLFLGGLGLHRFYVGKVGSGIVWLLTLGWWGIGSLIDCIMILCGVFTDGEGRDLV